jgi:hypothetical protein
VLGCFKKPLISQFKHTHERDRYKSFCHTENPTLLGVTAETFSWQSIFLSLSQREIERERERERKRYMRRGTALCSRDLFKEELKMKNGSHHSFFCTNQKRHSAIQSGPFSACLQREKSLRSVPFLLSLSPRSAAARHPHICTNEREKVTHTHTHTHTYI